MSSVGLLPLNFSTRTDDWKREQRKQPELDLLMILFLHRFCWLGGMFNPRKYLTSKLPKVIQKLQAEPTRISERELHRKDYTILVAAVQKRKKPKAHCGLPTNAKVSPSCSNFCEQEARKATIFRSSRYQQCSKRFDNLLSVLSIRGRMASENNSGPSRSLFWTPEWLLTAELLKKNHYALTKRCKRHYTRHQNFCWAEELPALHRIKCASEINKEHVPLFVLFTFSIFFVPCTKL